MKINENIIIQCKNLEEVKDCLNKLQELGFETKMKEYNDCLMVIKSIYDEEGYFRNFREITIDKNYNVVNYNYFLKLYNRQIQKEQKLKLIVNKNGKILKKDYLGDYKGEIFYYNTEKNIVDEIPASSLFVEERFDNIDFYTNKEACEKAVKYKAIENKLRLLAFELNGNGDIDCDKKECKYYIYYDYNADLIKTYIMLNIKGINIYCYSAQFKDKAIELIGKKELKDYLMNC